MTQDIRTIEDVKTFFEELKAESLNFHPDNLFEDYINYETSESTYTAEQCAVRDKLLDQAFEVCDSHEVDIYELCLDIFMNDFDIDFTEKS